MTQHEYKKAGDTQCYLPEGMYSVAELEYILDTLKQVDRLNGTAMKEAVLPVVEPR